MHFGSDQAKIDSAVLAISQFPEQRFRFNVDPDVYDDRR